jgi:hypothetical protein
MKDLSYIHKKIIKAGINTVVSVTDAGLSFAPEATPAQITAATAIFNAYMEINSDKFDIAVKMIAVQASIDACKQVEKDITIPNGIKTDLQAEYAALKTEFNS